MQEAAPELSSRYLEAARAQVASTRTALKVVARDVAHAALAVHADPRAMRVFAQAAELADDYLARAIDDLARAEAQP